MYLSALGSERVSEPPGAAADSGLQNAPREEHCDPEPDESSPGRERPGKEVVPVPLINLTWLW